MYYNNIYCNVGDPYDSLDEEWMAHINQPSLMPMENTTIQPHMDLEVLMGAKGGIRNGIPHNHIYGFLQTFHEDHETQLVGARVTRKEHDHALEMEGRQNNELSQLLPIDGQWFTSHDVEAYKVQVHEHVHHDNTINTMEIEDMTIVDAHGTGVERHM
jgi:hypothetical protein